MLSTGGGQTSGMKGSEVPKYAPFLIIHDWMAYDARR